MADGVAIGYVPVLGFGFSLLDVHEMCYIRFGGKELFKNNTDLRKSLEKEGMDSLEVLEWLMFINEIEHE